jgi:hypothetical protein
MKITPKNAIHTPKTIHCTCQDKNIYCSFYSEERETLKYVPRTKAEFTYNDQDTDIL